MNIEKAGAMPGRRRWVAILPAVLLCIAACAHDRAAGQPAVGAMQNDSPAISPWAETPPNVSIEEDPVYTRVPAP